MKNLIFYFYTLSFLILFISCGGKKTSEGENTEPPKSMVNDKGNYDPNRGEGKFSAENVLLGASLDKDMAKKGDAISATKCTSCHKLTDEKLVGPGWQGVTTRRSPHWIMNFITNPDPMIDKDPAVQAMLELCLVRMPNQALKEEEARNILEYMRQIDGVK